MAPPFGGVREGIEIDGVTAGYGDPDVEPPALDALSLTVPAASSVGIVGPSGSGKSTLLGVILGRVVPWKGAVRYGGRDRRRIDERDFYARVAAVDKHSSRSAREARRGEATLVSVTHRLVTAPWCVVCRRGDPGDAFYVVADGCFEALVGEDPDEPTFCRRMRKGEIFGELALLDGSPRTATVRAEEPSVALALFARHFHELRARSERLAAHVDEVAAERRDRM